MGRRAYVEDEVQKFAAYFVIFQCSIEVALPNSGIDFALSNERSIHAVLTNHRLGRRARDRKMRPLRGHDASADHHHFAQPFPILVGSLRK